MSFRSNVDLSARVTAAESRIVELESKLADLEGADEAVKERGIELTSCYEHIARLEAALISIRDFENEENEWDGVDRCMPAMRKLAADALRSPPSGETNAD